MSPLALSLRFLEKQPDSRLAELAAAGHERAFEALVQRYRRALLGYCRRFFPSDAGAEDVLQQALLQAWMALSREKSEVRDVRPWLYRIAHNVAVSNLRRPVDDSFREDTTRTAIGPDEEMERRAAAREALAGLAALPEPQRQVMFSTALEGRSHEEIAAGLGLSQGAVRGLIYRARATLRSAAAAIVPGPLLQWFVRRAGERGSAAGQLEAVAGGGAAGMAGIVLKGGAVVIAAGAIVAGTGVTSHHAPGKRGGAQGARVLSTGAPVTSGGGRAQGATSSAAASAAARSQGGGTAASGASGSNLARSGQAGTPIGGGQRTISTATGGSGSGRGPAGSSGTQPITTSAGVAGTTSGPSGGHGGGGGEGGSSSGSGSGGSSGGGEPRDGGRSGSGEGGGGEDGSSSKGSSGGSGSTSGGGSARDGGGSTERSRDGGSGRD